MDEQYYETLLNIKTTGEQKHFYESFHYHRYEPTPYIALNTLAEQYRFTEGDHVVDFGCGKGRFPLYINHFFNSSVTGVEMNSLYYEIAIKNRNALTDSGKTQKNRIQFVNCQAESYRIDPINNKFYFFNPFSVQIFAKVVTNILISKEEHDREIDIILYYPSTEYIYYLDTKTPFMLLQEINIADWPDIDPREGFVIYRAESSFR